MTNVGNVTGRFRVKQPHTPYVRVVYQPQPIAAGIRIKMEVELRAVALGEVQEEVQIHTEDDMFRLPVSARVVSEAELQGRLPGQTGRMRLLDTTTPPPRTQVVKAPIVGEAAS